MALCSTLRFSRPINLALFALVATGTSLVSIGEAAAAPLLPCTGTQTDLRAVLAAQPNANAAAGPLDDGGVQIGAATVSTIFPTGIPFTNGMNTSFFVNVNGSVSFGQAVSTFTPVAIPGLVTPAIAAFFGDVDLRGALSTGALTLCAEPANQRFIITWDDVGYYNQQHLLKNSFQIVMTNNDAAVCPSAANFEVEFRYESLAWTTGDASGGTLGLGGNEATAGLDAGNGNAVALPGSGTAAVLQLPTLTNANDPGVFRFLVAQGTLPRCGNGTTQLCEECDDANQDNGDACTNLCQLAECGDGLLHINVEQCDQTDVPANNVCPMGYSGTPLCNNDPANPNGNNTCTFDPIPDGCVDDDECTLMTDNCALEATCTNTPGSFTCACVAGYMGDGVVCTDIDECLTMVDNCATDATCTNTPGSFTCACNQGFMGDGIVCTPIGQGSGGAGGAGGAATGGAASGGAASGGAASGGASSGGAPSGGASSGGASSGGASSGGASSGGASSGGTGGDDDLKVFAEGGGFCAYGAGDDGSFGLALVGLVTALAARRRRSSRCG